MKATAPGKIILSGEHAVVHGRPALVVAVDRCATARASLIDDDLIRVSFPGCFDPDSMPTAALPGLKKRLVENYQQFLIGEMAIHHVLGSPAELIFYAVMHLLDESGAVLHGGLDIELNTTLPLGAGMGTSAAVSAATLSAVAELLDISPERDDLYRWTLDVEKLQHGHPSGVDPFITVHGGCVRFQEGEAIETKSPRKPLTIAATGSPASSTGECVDDVFHRFPATDSIWSQFERVTNEMEAAIRNDDSADFRATVKANHRLLCQIGVVPQRVQHFIEELEGQGGAGKICGAGAIRGDAAGVVMVLGDAAATLCQQYGYESLTLRVDHAGLRTE
jgi:mevalonate kinase